MFRCAKLFGRAGGAARRDAEAAAMVPRRTLQPRLDKTLPPISGAVMLHAPVASSVMPQRYTWSIRNRALPPGLVFEILDFMLCGTRPLHGTTPHQDSRCQDPSQQISTYKLGSRAGHAALSVHSPRGCSAQALQGQGRRGAASAASTGRGRAQRGVQGPVPWSCGACCVLCWPRCGGAAEKHAVCGRQGDVPQHVRGWGRGGRSLLPLRSATCCRGS